MEMEKEIENETEMIERKASRRNGVTDSAFLELIDKRSG
jgi:hypothetical protein